MKIINFLGIFLLLHSCSSLRISRLPNSSSDCFHSLDEILKTTDLELLEVFKKDNIHFEKVLIDIDGKDYEALEFLPKIGKESNFLSRYIYRVQKLLGNKRFIYIPGLIPENEGGRYYFKNSYIVLSKDLLIDINSFDSKTVIFHEVRHAYLYNRLKLFGKTIYQGSIKGKFNFPTYKNGFSLQELFTYKKAIYRGYISLFKSNALSEYVIDSIKSDEILEMNKLSLSLLKLIKDGKYMSKTSFYDPSMGSHFYKYEIEFDDQMISINLAYNDNQSIEASVKENIKQFEVDLEFFEKMNDLHQKLKSSRYQNEKIKILEDYKKNIEELLPVKNVGNDN